MPFGLSGAPPATYQRLMRDVLGDLHMRICCIFINDVIIFSLTFQEHLERLELVFNRIKEANLKLSPQKCTFFKRKVKYIGHVVSAEGVKTDPEKISKVVDWPTPTNAEEVRKFIGFAGYFRRFIQNFSQISKPLTELFPSTSKRKKQKQAKNWEWGKQQQTAVDVLKAKLLTTPVLSYPDFAKPFELHTDASGQGLGAVLYQDQD
jgi:hypothetical protein